MRIIEEIQEKRKQFRGSNVESKYPFDLLNITTSQNV